MTVVVQGLASHCWFPLPIILLCFIGSFFTYHSYIPSAFFKKQLLFSLFIRLLLLMSKNFCKYWDILVIVNIDK